MLKLSIALPADILDPEIRAQINSCKDACQIYRKSFKNFLVSMDRVDWEYAKWDFQNSKDKCSRCSLRNAALGMDYIEKKRDDFPSHAMNLKAQQYVIIPAIADCLSNWENSAIFGCENSPVEKYTTECVLY